MRPRGTLWPLWDVTLEGQAGVEEFLPDLVMALNRDIPRSMRALDWIDGLASVVEADFNEIVLPKLADAAFRADLEADQELDDGWRPAGANDERHRWGRSRL